jgi:hypothetical protein
MNQKLVCTVLPFFMLHKSFFDKLDATDENETIMENARNFRENFNLKASRIACQILIQEDQLLHLTHMTCLTDIMIERM